jgi:hypothetical protein
VQMFHGLGLSYMYIQSQFVGIQCPVWLLKIFADGEVLGVSVLSFY